MIMSSADIMSLEDQARIELTLQTRERIIRGMTGAGKLPEAPEDRTFLMQALDGMDRTVLTKAKIKSDDSAAKNQADTAKAIAELLNRVDSRQRSVTHRAIDVDAIELPMIDLVEGETSIGVQTFKSDQIVNGDYD